MSEQAPRLEKDLWAAPRATGPVDATVALPGSKSATNRALVLAALSDGESVLHQPLRARDTLLMAAGLRSLGVEITDEGPDWRVRPSVLRGPATVDVGNAGTVLRFLPPVAALAEGAVRFTGDARAAERPLGPVLQALGTLGADIDDGGRPAVPFTVHGAGGLSGGEVEIDSAASSQFLSALLLAGARFDRGLTVRHIGSAVPSAPHVAMTVQMVRSAGASVDDARADVWVVEPGKLSARDWEIEPDLSNAAAFLAAAVVTGGRVRVPGWPGGTAQAGDALRCLLTQMGATVGLDSGVLEVSGTGRLQGLTADLHDVGELTPVLAALGALAASPSRLSGIGHLRNHETDRLAALTAQLSGLGAEVNQTEDGLLIRPRPLHGGIMETYDDHRLATAGAVLGLVVDGVLVRDIATTVKTIPDFPGMWAAMLAGASG